eukprot:7186213-Prymnesium_polylepis.1
MKKAKSRTSMGKAQRPSQQPLKNARSMSSLGACASPSISRQRQSKGPPVPSKAQSTVGGPSVSFTPQ